MSDQCTILGGFVKSEMAPDHLNMSAILASTEADAGTAAIRPVLIDGLKINAMPTALALGLHEVVEPANAEDVFTCEDERL